MITIVTPTRYVFLALFVIFNAIVCSAAAWDLGVAQLFHHHEDIDVVLVFVSALSFTFVLSLAAFEFARKDVFTSRVWFECAWLGTFLILHFSCAVARTAIGSVAVCDLQGVMTRQDYCTPTRLLEAFSWICTLLLLAYLLVLSISAVVRYQQDPTVWQASVREYRWRDMRRSLDATPALPRFRRDFAPSIKAPRPLHLASNALYAHRESKASVETSPCVSAAPRQQMREATGTSSLYPVHVQSYVSQQPSQARSASPPPLGDWPRANVMNEPLRKKRRDAPPAPTTVPHPVRSSSRRVPPPRSTSADESPVQTPVPPRAKKPSRDLRDRVTPPPPLDLSKISANRAGRSVTAA